MELSSTHHLSAVEARSNELNSASSPVVDKANDHVLPTINNDLESPLCDDCKEILAKFPDAQVGEGKKPFFSTTKQKVEAQAANGCHLCRWFLKYGDLEEEKELVCTRQIEEDFDEQRLWLGGGQALLTRKLTDLELDEGSVEPAHS
jgi:hypothetical protein